METESISLDFTYDDIILLHNLVLSYNKSKVGRQCQHKALEIKLLKALVENE